LKAAGRRWIVIAVAGLAGAGVADALVGTTRPLYEAEAVLVAPSAGLLDRYDRLVALGPAVTHVRGSDTIGGRDLGDVAAVAIAVRRRLGLAADGGTLDVSVDSNTGEASVVARHTSPRISERLANGVADGVISQRAAVLSDRLAYARALRPLLASLATRSVPAARRAAVVRDRISGLVQLRASAGTGWTTLRRASIPAKPVAPRVARDVVLAALLAALGAYSVGALRRRASRSTLQILRRPPIDRICGPRPDP
jgi:hypothetical protein